MCQPATLTTQEEEDAISGIRMYAMISGALASIGALPALAGGIAKTLGKQGLSDGCGLLALCSTCFLSCCGALAFAAIPFTFAAIISTLCTQWENDLERFESEGGSDSCTGECLEALKDIAGGWCGLSGSILVSTIIAIIAALFGVLTTILTVVGFTQRKKTAPQQTVVVVQQNAAPAPAAVVPVAATATVVDKN